MRNNKLHTSKLAECVHGDQSGSSWYFWCPGCDEIHNYIVRNNGHRPAWVFNGNHHSPSFTPSLLHPSKTPLCHLFVTNGKIDYCGDCGHALAGKTIDMVDFPEYWANYFSSTESES